MRSLIPEQVNSALNDIVTKCFEGNRIADRGMSVLSVKFAMHKTEEILHEKLAHLFPLLADSVSGFQNSRGSLTDYGLTPEDTSDYDSPLDFFEKILGYCQELEGLIADTIDLSKSEDMVAYSFLVKFIRKVSATTNQCLLLVEKSIQFGDDYKMFDHLIEDFIIL